MSAWDLRLAPVEATGRGTGSNWRAEGFYRPAGFREDFDYGSGEDFRVVQITPPGSGASIIFGKGITAGAPGSVEGPQLAILRKRQAARRPTMAGSQPTGASWSLSTPRPKLSRR